MQNIKEIKKLIRKNPGKYASISTTEDGDFEEDSKEMFEYFKEWLHAHS